MSPVACGQGLLFFCYILHDILSQIYNRSHIKMCKHTKFTLAKNLIFVKKSTYQY